GSILNIIYLIILIATTLIGNVGNVLVIGAVVCDRKLRKEGNVFIVNLAIADLCVTSVVDPFSVAGVLVGHQWFLDRHVLCHAIGSICLVSCVCSLWSIAAISVNRFVLLCRQTLYRKIFTWRSAIHMSLGLWVVAILLDLPNFLDWSDHTYDMKTMACSYDRTASYSYTVFFITLFVTIPLFVVVYCNIKIYSFVLRSRIRDYASDPLTSKNRVLPGKREIRQEVKLAKTLFLIFLVFCVCWAPYALVCLIDRYDRISKDVYTVAILMAHSSSTLNSILYCATNKRFRDGYRLFLGKCL
ncbi:hypothetical protein CAPTEDRAFT_64190, partial [Capitella teleta]